MPYLDPSSPALRLEHLIEGLPEGFREEVLRALEAEGFDLSTPLPNLQRPEELLGALTARLAHSDPTLFARVEVRLASALTLGVLVDLSGLSTRLLLRPPGERQPLRPGRGKVAPPARRLLT